MLFNPLQGQINTDFRVTQWFGENPAYYARYGHKGHNGVDYAPRTPGATGVIVYAPHEGYVKVKNEGRRGYGLYIEIRSLPYQHCNGRKSDLAHLAQVFVSDDQFISAGDPIGIMGNTGDSSNVHLHHTYKKINSFGETLDKNNGYGGAIDIARYIQLWKHGNTLRPLPS